MNLLLMLMAALAAGDDDLLISDFEGKDYGAWTVTGTAFGPGPAAGALPGQMSVTGYQGKGLVNSFFGGDTSVGTLTSPPFVISRKAINFLIGGGRHPGETCMNLRIDGAVVRSATGRDSEHLDWDGWDVAEFSGRTATLEIVDRHSGGWGHICVDQIVQSDRSLGPEAHAREFAVEGRYLFLPVRTGLPKRQATLTADGMPRREFEIELAERDPQFWAFVDLREWKGKTLRLVVVGPPAVKEALEAVTQGDELRGAAPLYAEPLRPQVHFTSRRGWLNDPNGLVYCAAEYHLFYQHNPFGWAWGNMHWGHAVSRDLVHWEELPIALHPLRSGDWAFSGSAVVDAANSSGFKSGAEDVLVAAYTSTGRGECIVYSNDRGRTWVEYSGNPVVKHQGRDPRLLWHAPTKRWVMAVYHESGKTQSIAFHTSPDLKTWTYRSRIDGFYECPDLFELAAEGDAATKRWVLLAADGRYLLGSFDGETFTPQGEKRAVWHGAFYASQTFSNEPSGRRIQIGWARGTDFPGMPFNQQMNVPVELRLKSTPDGLRLAATPVKEIESLRARKTSWDARPLRAGERLLDETFADAADLELGLRPGSAEQVVLGLHGLSLVVDVRRDLLKAGGLSAPLHSPGGVLRLRIIVDRGSVEVFSGDGLSALCVPHRIGEDRSFTLSVVGGAAEVESATLFDLRSAWK
jgi:fructan beta-fructosidase